MVSLVERRCAILMSRVRVQAWILFHFIGRTRFKQLKYEIFNTGHEKFSTEKFPRIIQIYTIGRNVKI